MRPRIGNRALLCALLPAAATTSSNAQPPESPAAARQRVATERQEAPKGGPISRVVSPRQCAIHHHQPALEYKGQDITWYDALLHSLNSKNIDWGTSWKRRRANFLENTVGNRCFVFYAFLVLCFYASLVTIGWIACLGGLLGAFLEPIKGKTSEARHTPSSAV